MRYIDKVKAAMRTPEGRAKAIRAGEAILALKGGSGLTPSQVHVDKTLTQVSVQYQNESFIGLRLMPVVQVDKPSDKYFVYAKRDRLNAPDDQVGNRGSVNEVFETRSTDSYNAVPRALKGCVTDRTLRAADVPLNEMVDCVASVNDALDLNEEIRIATAMTTPGNFSGQTAAIAAADRWDVGGEPDKDIQTARDAIWRGAGATRVVMWSDIATYRALSRHPRILDLFKHQTSGFATRAMIASFFDCDEYLTGEGRVDTANIGQTAAYSRIWGAGNFGICRVATAPSPRIACVGFTYRFGPKSTTQWFDPEPDVTGVYWSKTSVDEDHKIVAPDTAYLLTTCIG